MIKSVKFGKSLILAVVMTFCINLGLGLAATQVAQRSSLNGVVVAQCLAKVGQTVKEGQVLVNVKTLAGNMPAIRANCNGRVVKNSAVVGMQIKVGQVLVMIEKQ